MLPAAARAQRREMPRGESGCWGSSRSLLPAGIPIGWAGFPGPGRAGSAAISSGSAAGCEIRARPGGLSPLRDGAEEVPALRRAPAARCPGLPCSGESSSVQLCPIV